jgi:uncharacterized protein YbjQ (UPF0145 family)
MQISETGQLEGGRQTFLIGRIRAVSAWRGAAAERTDAERAAALKALIREAEDCGADAIVSVNFEVDAVKGSDIDGVPLRRMVASGLAVRLAMAA